MKTWVFVVILALGVLANRVDAQTNFTFGIPSQSKVGVPSITTTNPVFGRSFQSKSGVQTTMTTNFPFAIPSESKVGAPSTPATNAFFGRSFRIGAQTAATTNFSFGIPSQSKVGLLSTPATNPFFGRSFQTRSGGQITTATTTNLVNPTVQQPGTATSSAQSATANFLFASSGQSWVGQGQSLFATATNGYNVSLTQFAPNILQFNISPADSAVTNWLLEFSTTNDFFVAGIYSNAVNAGGSPSRLVFGGMGRADNTSDGAFKVLEATYSGNQIVSFAADFIQFDNNDTNSWNEGSIRYNSTIPDTVNLFMAPVAISFHAGNAVLTWSTNLADFQLEYATNLPASAWFTNNSVPAIVDGQYTVIDTNGISAGTRLYRLLKRL